MELFWRLTTLTIVLGLIAHNTYADSLQLSRALSFGASTEGANLQLSDRGDFAFFYFVRQWPAGYCSIRSCVELHVDKFQFTIHGLWPNYADDTYPQFCDRQKPFSESMIEDLLPEMEVEWPSFSRQGEDSFWKHEWEKHGTCSLSVLSDEHEYFKTALKLHDEYSIAMAMKAANIVPSSQRLYKKQDLLDAINKEYGVTAQVHCLSNTLVEVWLCVDKHLNVYSCEKTRSTYEECPDEIQFPPLAADPSI